MSITPAATTNTVQYAEEAVLAILMRDWPAASLLHALPEEFFRDPPYRTLYRLIEERNARGDTLDVNLIAGEYTAAGGDRDVVDRVMRSQASPVATAEYVRILTKDAQERLILSALMHVQAHWQEEPMAMLEQLKVKMERYDHAVVPQARGKSAADAVQSWLTDQPVPMLKTGLAGFDNLLGGGLRRGELTVLVAPSNVGKSILAGLIGKYVASARNSDGTSVFYASLEMMTHDLLSRLISAQASISADQYEAWRLGRIPPGWTDAKREAIEGAAREIARSRLYFFDQEDCPTIGPTEVHGQVKAWNRTLMTNHQPAIGLVIVDFMQIMDFAAERTENNANRLGRLAKELKRIALLSHCHVLAIASLRRFQGLEPTLDDIRDSGEIAYNADSVIGMTDRRDIDLSSCGPGWVVDEDRGSRYTLLSLNALKVRKSARYTRSLLRFEGGIQQIRDVTQDERSAFHSLREQGRHS